MANDFYLIFYDKGKQVFRTKKGIFAATKILINKNPDLNVVLQDAHLKAGIQGQFIFLAKNDKMAAAFGRVIDNAGKARILDVWKMTSV